MGCCVLVLGGVSCGTHNTSPVTRLDGGPSHASDGGLSHASDGGQSHTRDSGRDSGRDGGHSTLDAGKHADGGHDARGVSPEDGGTDVVVTIAAAGDISDYYIDNQMETSDLIIDGGYAAVLTLGDNQYYGDDVSTNFEEFFGSTWGRFKAKIFPATGNHEYGVNTPVPAGYYFGYFFKPDAADNNPVIADSSASDPDAGYYSYNLGTWHLIALNTNIGMPLPDGGKENEDTACAKVPCNAGSPQEQWLQHDLAHNNKLCTIAYWHQARFTAGGHSNDPDLQAIWNDLYDAGVDIVLNGHDHNYQRFAAMNPDGGYDPEHGIVEFIVGTGGTGIPYNTHMSPHDLHPNAAEIPRTLEKYEDGTFGILKLTLRPGSYEYEFVSANHRGNGGYWQGQGPAADDGATTVVITDAGFVDKGSGICH
jgi:acid phosphatase type 7